LHERVYRKRGRGRGEKTRKDALEEPIDSIMNGGNRRTFGQNELSMGK